MFKRGLNARDYSNIHPLRIFSKLEIQSVKATKDESLLPIKYSCHVSWILSILQETHPLALWGTSWLSAKTSTLQKGMWKEPRWKWLNHFLESLFGGSSREAQLPVYHWPKIVPLLWLGRLSSLTKHTATRGTHTDWWGWKGTPAEPARSAKSTPVISRVTSVAATLPSHLVDSFSKKDWWDMKVSAKFNIRNTGKTQYFQSWKYY